MNRKIKLFLLTISVLLITFNIVNADNFIESENNCEVTTFSAKNGEYEYEVKLSNGEEINITVDYITGAIDTESEYNIKIVYQEDGKTKIEINKEENEFSFYPKRVKSIEEIETGLLLEVYYIDDLQNLKIKEVKLEQIGENGNVNEYSNPRDDSNSGDAQYSISYNNPYYQLELIEKNAQKGRAKGYATYEKYNIHKSIIVGTELISEQKFQNIHENPAGKSIMYAFKPSEFKSEKMSAFTISLYKIVKALVAPIIFTAVIIVGVKIIIFKKAPQERVKAMYSIVYIFIGAMIIGGALVISSFMSDIAQRSARKFENEYSELKSEKVLIDSTGRKYMVIAGEKKYIDALVNNKKIEFENQENDFSKVIKYMWDIILAILTVIFTAILDFLKDIRDLIFGMDTSIERIVFLKETQGNPISMYEPFRENEFKVLKNLYNTIAMLMSPVIFLMVAKTGFGYLIYSDNVKRRAQLKNDISKWFFGIFAIMIFPTVFMFVLSFFNELTKMLPVGMFRFDYTEVLGRNSAGFESMLVALMSFIIEFKILLIFLVRKIALSLVFAIAPIMFVLWGMGVGKNVVKVWFGDIFQNASTQFFYGLILTILVFIIGTYEHNWFYVFAWLFMALTLAKTLKKSLQKFTSEAMGIDEENLALGDGGALEGFNNVVNRGHMIAGAVAQAGTQSIKTAQYLNQIRKGEVYTEAKKNDMKEKFNKNNPNMKKSIDDYTEQDVQNMLDVVSKEMYADQMSRKQHIENEFRGKLKERITSKKEKLNLINKGAYIATGDEEIGAISKDLTGSLGMKPNFKEFTQSAQEILKDNRNLNDKYDVLKKYGQEYGFNVSKNDDGDIEIKK